VSEWRAWGKRGKPNGGGSNGLNDSKVSNIQIEYRNNAKYKPWGCYYFPLKVFFSIAKVSLKGCTYNTYPKQNSNPLRLKHPMCKVTAPRSEPREIDGEKA
jgi:hypothetical protein